MGDEILRVKVRAPQQISQKQVDSHSLIISADLLLISAGFYLHRFLPAVVSSIQKRRLSSLQAAACAKRLIKPLIPDFFSDTVGLIVKAAAVVQRYPDGRPPLPVAVRHSRLKRFHALPFPVRAESLPDFPLLTPERPGDFPQKQNRLSYPQLQQPFHFRISSPQPFQVSRLPQPPAAVIRILFPGIRSHKPVLPFQALHFINQSPYRNLPHTFQAAAGHSLLPDPGAAPFLLSVFPPKPDCLFTEKTVKFPKGFLTKPVFPHKNLRKRAVRCAQPGIIKHSIKLLKLVLQHTLREYLHLPVL